MIIWISGYFSRQSSTSRAVLSFDSSTRVPMGISRLTRIRASSAVGKNSVPTWRTRKSDPMKIPMQTRKVTNLWPTTHASMRP